MDIQKTKSAKLGSNWSGVCNDDEKYYKQSRKHWNTEKMLKLSVFQKPAIFTPSIDQF